MQAILGTLATSEEPDNIAPSVLQSIRIKQYKNFRKICTKTDTAEGSYTLSRWKPILDTLGQNN
jgi:hypothetical protein